MTDSSIWVWVDGRVSPAGDARVAALDHGVTVGDGVFETLKVVDGIPFALTRHLRRLRRSAAVLGLDLAMSDDDLRTAAADTVAAASVGTGHDRAHGGGTAGRPSAAIGRLRITVTGGPGPLGSGRDAVPPSVILAAAPGAAWPPWASVVTVPWTRNERSAVAGAKTTSYAENVVALARAHAQGASEAILANTVGALCEGTGSNVFLVRDGRLVTPSLATGCLAGITRELLLEVVDAQEIDDLTLDDLRHAPEAFLTSSTRDVQPIGSVDGRTLPRPCPGPLTASAMEAFGALQDWTLDP